MKKILMSLAALFVVLPYVHAKDIEYITMDTPVKWNPDSINLTIEELLDSSLFRTNLGSTTVGDFNGANLPVGFANFIEQYIDTSKNGRRGVSLREMVDICLGSGIDALYCERLVTGVFDRQNDVYYGIGASLPNDLKAISDSEKIFSDDGKYYASIRTKGANAFYTIYRASDNTIICGADDIARACFTTEGAILYKGAESAMFSLYNNPFSTNALENTVNDSFGTEKPVLRYSVR